MARKRNHDEQHQPFADPQTIAVIAAEEPGMNLTSVLEWQHRLRDAVDSLVADRLRLPFAQEFMSRFENEEIPRAEVCKWTNRILHESRLYLECPESKLPCYLLFNKPTTRQYDSGRIYLQTVGVSPRRRTFIVREAREFSFVAAHEQQRGSPTAVDRSPDR